MSEYSIHRATIKDVDELTALSLKLFYETGVLQGDGPASELVEITRTYLRDNLATDHFIAWIAEVEGKIIAMSGLVFFEKPPTKANISGLEAYIMNMYTLPEWRGRGVATQLVQEIINFVKKTDAKRIWLRTTKDGQKVYEQCGFNFTSYDMELVW